MSVYVMPRVRAGVADPGKWEVKVLGKWKDGTAFRKRYVVGKGTAVPEIRTEKQAHAWGAVRYAELYGTGEPPVVEPEPEKPASEETVSAWWKRYMEYAEAGKVGKKNKGRPQVNVEDRRARFRRYVEPAIGALRMTDVTPKHLRRIVEKLDEQIDLRTAFYDSNGDDERKGGKPGMSWKSAAHIWSEITSGFREAVRSKIERLRIEGLTDPTRDVEPPKKTEDRTQASLYSSEVVQLLACEAIPLSRRRVYALALYLGVRLSELARIVASDVDFEHNMVVVRGTKTTAARRRVPIEPALLPLLKKLVKERPEGPLVDAPRADGKGGASWLIQRDIETAGLKRAELYQDDAHMMPFTFHGCRHTAITHAYIAGRDETWLRIVYGHTMSEMTRRYLDAAALTRSTFGVPFPPLPPSVLGGAKVVSISSARTA